ncbi:hypothetical protein [Xanthobacter sediminis]
MGAVIAYDPGARGPGAIAKLVWCASQSLLEAARMGEPGATERNGRWLHALREDARCSPALARIIDGSLTAAASRLSAPAPTGDRP